MRHLLAAAAMAAAMAAAWMVPAAFLSACSGDPATRPQDTVTVVGACSVAVAEHPDEGAVHAVPCTQVAFNTNPPTSGTHYSSWAAYKTYAQPVPDGFLVHSLEHGALVIGYDCPEGCPDEVAAVQKWIDGLATDPVCFGEKPKIILAPNPALDVRWAAAAWNWSWKAPCPDTLTLAAFFQDHYGKTPETGVCGGGSDLSAVGWCPAPE